jgi:diaminohydroxyphosphoribosylaminopyrimidine deaminase/5-amino-6-(5-phosphoribosylamino)uracil reductase
MIEERFMHRALELAKKGQGSVAPNPMVGCVIVHEGKIIGEGYHQIFGGPHAEVNAINSVMYEELLPLSDVYVTLEPCSHLGKTPPCADLLLEKKVKRVIICNQDPFPAVSGRGIAKLQNAGIEVQENVLSQLGKALNKRFFTFHEKKRPYVILKWAQTQDRFLARENFDSKWISNSRSRQLVHKWRSEEAAILVGAKTAQYDNPTLTVRDWEGKNPVRVVIDREVKLDTSLHLFDGEVSTICFTSVEKKSKHNLEYIMLSEITPATILSALYEKGIQSIIIEGGAQVLGAFIDHNVWDEARKFTAPVTFGIGIQAPKLAGQLAHSEFVNENLLETYLNI